MSLRSLRTKFWEARQLLGAGRSFRRQAAQLMAGDRKGLIDYLYDFSHGPYCVRPIQVRSELGELFEVMCKLQPRMVVEIGTSLGGTLCLAMLALRKPGLAVSVDLPGGGSWDKLHRWHLRFLQLALAEPHKRLVFIRDDSHRSRVAERVQRLAERYGGLDFLLIDGDHSLEGVRRDWESYAPLVKPGGIVALHDIVPHPQFPDIQVAPFWKALQSRLPAGAVQEIVADPQQGWGIGLVTVSA